MATATQAELQGMRGFEGMRGLECCKQHSKLGGVLCATRKKLEEQVEPHVRVALMEAPDDGHASLR